MTLKLQNKLIAGVGFLLTISLYSIPTTLLYAQNSTTTDADLSDLEEAPGLEDTSKPPVFAAPENKLKYRGYGLIDYHVQRINEDLQKYFPNTEFSLTADYKIHESVHLFFDGRATSIDEIDTQPKSQTVLDQFGARFQIDEHISAAIGKERNRRSPGLVVSPSDFINSNEQLPGQRQERGGIWLTRASYQRTQDTLDIILLPVTKTQANGLPESNEGKFLGFAGRYLHQFSNFDFNLNLGSINEIFRAGISTQAIIASAYKIYWESGYEDKINIGPYQRKAIMSHLIGLGYEGFENLSLRGELYWNGAGLSKEEWYFLKQTIATHSESPAQISNQIPTQIKGPFLRQLYAIGSISISDILNCINATETMIKSLEDDSYLNVSRADWLATDHQVLGINLFHVSESNNSHYIFRVFDWQAGIDWRYSF